MLNPNLINTDAHLVGHASIDAFLVESDDPYFAYSARGGAEVTNTPTPAAIRNAVYHAIGIWFNHLPMTPDKVIKAIQLKKERSERNATRASTFQAYQRNPY